MYKSESNYLLLATTYVTHFNNIVSWHDYHCYYNHIFSPTDSLHQSRP